MVVDSGKLRRLLLEYNGFWKGEAYDVEFKPRGIYARLQKFVGEKQIIALCGLRRVGKTTLLRKIISDLLQHNDAGQIAYFSFDDFFECELYDVVDACREINGVEPRFLFLDEVQKLANWAEKTKVLYDSGKYKIFVSGSESLFLRKHTRESLAGRIYEFEVTPLSFKEYLAFVGKQHYCANAALYEKELQAEMQQYFLCAGFPEIIGKDAETAREYLSASVLEKIVFKDIPELYSVESPRKLASIMEILLDNPGMLVDFTSLSKHLGLSRQTLSKYFEFLEAAQLVRKLYNYSKNKLTSEKKLKKYYPSFLSPAMTAGKDESYQGKVVECFCANNSGAKFFWRDASKNEVDFILEREGKILPVEVKYREKLEKNRGLAKFCAKYGHPAAITVTKNRRGSEKNSFENNYLPAFEFLLRENE